MVDGCVIVTFTQYKVSYFVLLEMNCKINSLGGAQIPYFVHKWRHGAFLYLENILNCFVPFNRSWNHCNKKIMQNRLFLFFYVGLIYPTHFL